MAIEKLKRSFAKFARRHSTHTHSSRSSTDGEHTSIARSLKSRASLSIFGGDTINEKDEPGVGVSVALALQSADDDSAAKTKPQLSLSPSHLNPHLNSPQPLYNTTTTTSHLTTSHLTVDADADALRATSNHDSTSTAGFPTPNTEDRIEFTCVSPSPTASTSTRPSELQRQQSLLAPQEVSLINTLLETHLPPQEEHHGPTSHGSSPVTTNMARRKIWVKRPGASATLVTIQEDDLVDDVRDMILKKIRQLAGT